ncbi:efflux transporter outer membrane subunit [Salinisphaera sp. Q1T1-3]|nr:efflux transporter outer membrane subunit [Salinisphaera sp. Q1T1-3]
MIGRISRRTLAGLSLVALTGCANLAPDYERPAPVTPQLWPSVGAYGAPEPVTATDVADLGWRDFFVDAGLRHTVALALAHNRDLRVAALNIEAARAQYHDTRSNLFPSVDASGSATFSRAGRTSGRDDTASGNLANQSSVSRSLSAELGFASYEIDFFGRLRNQREAALNTLLSSAASRRATQISLIGEVATRWLTLAADQSRLALARQTLANQRDNLKLVQARHDYGVASGSDVANARSAVESARVDVASLTTTIAQDRNALNRIAGTVVPASALPGAELPEDAVRQKLPAGIPSRVLVNRPDVIAAEYTLRGDYASIGAARAAFFPRISLTAATGWATSGLSGLFADDNRSWSVTPAMDVPIFDGGSRAAQLDLAHVQRDIDLADYESTLQTAFREVADALAIRATIDDQIDAQTRLVTANARAYRLSLARYRAGTDSYQDTLVEQRALYSARQNEIDRRLARQTNLVTLYKVLGGGGLAESAGP